MNQTDVSLMNESTKIDEINNPQLEINQKRKTEAEIAEFIS